MNKTKFVILSLPLVVFLTFTGCKKNDSNPVSPEDQTQTTSASSQPMPSFATVTDYNGVCATVKFDMQSPISGFPAIEMNSALASMGAQGGADGGAIIVNNNTLGKMVAGGRVTYMAPDPNNPTASMSNIYFDGSDHSWSVAGANGISAFSGSVKSVSTYNLVSPYNGASVSKSSDLQVYWNGGTTSKTLIQISSITTGKTKVYQELADNGSYKISSADLAGLTGDCLLFVVKYNYNIVSAGGKKYVLVSEIVKSNSIKVN